MIEVNQLKKTFGGATALNSVSFTINTGEVVGFLGPNGAGKTTTMRLLTGFIVPNSGEVRINGKIVHTQPVEARRSIGYLPENNPLYDSMHVYEYLRFVAAAKGITNTQEAIKKVMSVCSLQEKIASEIADLSKGYRQRVGLAAALLGDPDILLLDEPTSGLDPNQAREVRSLIRKIGATKTVLFSTHILQEVQATCDRAIIIHKGNIVAQGTIDELRTASKGKTVIHVMIEGGEMQTIQEALRLLASVDRVEYDEATQRYSLEVNADVRKDIFTLCVARGWVLMEMQKTDVSLEDLFRQLTT